MNKTMILKPRLSEKAYAHSQTLNTFVIVVPGDATKHTVARAVAEQFEVTVVDVNIVNLKGKSKRTVSRGGRRVANGSQSDVKKAYVTLKTGDHLPFFAAEEEAEKEAIEAEEKAEKKAAKKAIKNVKKEESK
jgi:large subunit ribosomal protein L23